MKRLAIAAGVFTLVLVYPGLAQEDKDKRKDQDQDDQSPLKHLKFRLLGPAAGGRVARACGVAGDPSTYYAATAAGGVWKSADAGITWKPIFDDQPTSSIGSIAVAPSDANVIYVGSGEANIRGNVMPGNGIYKSTTGGKAWTHVWKQKGQIGKMLVHPTNADVAYAAVLGSAFGPNPERGIYRTSDGGKTWKQVLKKNADTGAIDVCFDPVNPRILFAALWETRRRPWNYTSGGPGSGLYRSEDGGDTWKELGPHEGSKANAGHKLDDVKPGPDDDHLENGLPKGTWGRVGIAVAPSDSRRVYALIEAEKGGLYRSDDGGEKWSLMSAARYLRQRPWYFSTVHVDAKNPDVVWCPNVRLLKSVDGGRTFKNVKGPHHPDHHDLWIDPSDPRRMIDSNDGGVDLTANGGETWHAPPLPIAQFYHVNVDNSVPYRVMGTMQDQGTASGPSNSLSSAGITLCDWHTVGGGETGFAVPHPRHPDIVFAGEYGGYISRFDLRSRQARNVSIYPHNPSGKGGEELKVRFQWTAPILVSVHEPYTLYHAGNVLFASTDEGTTWKAISPDLTRNDKQKQQWSGGPITGDNTGVEIYDTIFALAESPKKAGVLWAGTDDGLVHVSQDVGKSWTDVTGNIAGLPEWATVVCIEAAPADSAAAYVVVDAHRLDDNKPYLWKTRDFGKTWVSLAGKLPRDSHLRVVRADPVTPGLIYCGSETGVWFSRDDGKTWDRLKLNLPTAAVADLAVKNNDLVVGTSGRSIWVLDDLTPLRQWSPRLEKGPHLFDVQAAIRWRYHGENYSPEERIPGDNPPKGAVVSYYLDKRPKEEVTLEILDATGALVQKLSSKKQEPESTEDAPDVPWSIFKPTVLPKEPGINRTHWDLTRTGPKIIPGAKNDAGVPYRGPLVVPGTYTLKLHVDGTTMAGKVKVLPDPRARVSMDDLAARYAFAVQLADDISKLSGIVIDLQTVRRQLLERAKLWTDLPKGKELAAQADRLAARLDALESKLHNPKAEVTYDILAMKGGARLYSQLGPLYAVVNESDGPVTQGMRDVYADLAKELRTLETEWNVCRDALARLNQAAREAGIANVLVPAQK
jgi:photosystem II stability/assembly factor-like uncharacterized protein